MDTDDVPCSRCSAKQCTLAAILGTIAATAVAATVTVALRPVPLSFSITQGTSAHIRPLGATWAFTLVATNPSRRAGVWYLMLSVDMDYLAADGASWSLQAGVQTPCYQPPRTTTGFVLNFTMGEEDDLSDFGRVNTSVPMIAWVTAKLQFKVGPCYTRPYETTLTCEHVYFTDNSSSSATHREVRAPVNCTGTYT